MIALGVGSRMRYATMLMRNILFLFPSPGSFLSQLAFREANLENEAVMAGRLLLGRSSFGFVFEEVALVLIEMFGERLRTPFTVVSHWG